MGYVGRVGILEQRRTGRRFTLAASTLVGRSSNCTLVLDEPEVSSQHAALFFGERGWAVRDLGSRNGTALQGAAVLAGKRLVVEAGAEIAFAGDVWVLADAGPPVATAVAPDGRRHHAVDELLALPDPLDPVVTISPPRIAGSPRPTRGRALSPTARHWPSRVGCGRWSCRPKPGGAAR
ncbi:MAG: FHA domain-containing protein [Myxococcales bacterium]|nr:FHA domain-containing protein [Myxococcales bacterium]